MTHPYYVIRPPGQPERIAQTAPEAWRVARILAATTGADTAILRADASGPLRPVLIASPAWAHAAYHWAYNVAERLAALLADDVVIVARGRLFDILPADDVNVSTLATIGARYVARVSPISE
jgi:hypothetical protein